MNLLPPSWQAACFATVSNAYRAQVRVGRPVLLVPAGHRESFGSKKMIFTWEKLARLVGVDKTKPRHQTEWLPLNKLIALKRLNAIRTRLSVASLLFSTCHARLISHHDRPVSLFVPVFI